MFYWALLTLDKSQVSYRMHSADVENHLEAQTEAAWDGKQRQQRWSPGEVPGQEGSSGRLQLIASGQLDCFGSDGQQYSKNI